MELTIEELETICRAIGVVEEYYSENGIEISPKLDKLWEKITIRLMEFAEGKEEK
jgi:hypothetical protein